MAGSGKRKERREARLKDITRDVAGNITYTGDLYRIAGSDDSSAGRQKLMLVGGLIPLILTVVGSGCIDAKNAIGAFYVVLPYIGEVSALFGLAWNAAKLLYPKEGVRTYTFEHCRVRVPAACRILTVFALAGLLFSVIYMFRFGTGGKTADGMAYLMMKLASAALAEWYARRFKATDWEKIK